MSATLRSGLSLLRAATHKANRRLTSARSRHCAPRCSLRKAFAYADPARGATAGAHFAKVLTTPGINDTMANRTIVLVFGVEVIEAVAAGKFELGVSQSNEIVQHKGVRYLSALPPPYRLGTRYQVAALKAKPAAASLIEFLQISAARDAMRASSFATPE